MAAVLVAIIFLSICSAGQQGCPVPPPIHAQPGNIFTPQQEVELGDIIAEREENDFKVIRDGALNAKLQAVGDRVVKALPTDMPIRFVLVDIPVVNAFTMPGGRVYVTRKLVAFARSEDELAGVLAHEAGHALTHDPAVTMSQLLEKVLGIRSVGNRSDIYEKYNLLLDNMRRKDFEIKQHMNEKQLNADQVALYAVARAGYDPRAYAEAWDRLANTRGKTGNAFTDFFGATSPEQKRLREALKAVESIPRECMGTKSANSGFADWQKQVVEYSATANENIPRLIAHKQMIPPLRADVTNLKFSPDGKHILAQDDTTVFVLTRDPFAFSFRIDAPDAYEASFTPDSRSVLFYDKRLRVEKWDIEHKRRESVFDVSLTRSCWETVLSPDGRYLACYDTEGALRVFDVSTAASVFEKKSFYIPSFWEYLALLGNRFSDSSSVKLLQMHFSPDARYLVVSRLDRNIAIDLSTMKPVAMDGRLHELIERHFVFITPDQIIGTGGSKGEKSAIVSFPKGDVIRKDLMLGGAGLFATAKSDYVIVKPLKDYPVGLYDPRENKIVLGFETKGLDVHGNVQLFELRNGELQLRNVGEKQAIATLRLPDSSLSNLRAFDVTADLDIVAVSQRSRGGVWDLKNEKRLSHIRGVDSAWLDGDQHVVVDFRKKDEVKRSIVDIDLTLNDPKVLYELDDKDARERVWQERNYLLTLKPLKGDNLDKNCDLEFRNARTRELLWTQHFPREVPGIHLNGAAGTVVFGWDTRSGGVKQEVSSDASLKARLDALKDKELGAFLLAMDTKTGKKIGTVIIDTGKGSFKLEDVSAVGNWLVATDNTNRVLLYSLATGEQKAVYFGHSAEISPSGELLMVENEQGQVAAYSLRTFEKVDDYHFSAGVSAWRFSPDGKRLFVLTRTQQAYWIDMSGVGKEQEAK